MPPPPRRAPAGAAPAAAPGRLAAAAPFAAVDASAGALAKIIAAGRTSGTLQLSARGLAEVPAAVYDPDASAAAGGGAWWEVAELTRLDLSRNEVRTHSARLPLPGTPRSAPRMAHPHWPAVLSGQRHAMGAAGAQPLPPLLVSDRPT